MSSWLKQSTSVDVGVGPFLDETDGKTAETALTITQPDVRLKKNGGAWAQKAAAQTLTHEEAGWYEVTLDATDTNTLGLLIVAIHESGALPVWKEYMVVPANVYDAIVAGSDTLQADLTQVNGAAQTATLDTLKTDTAAILADTGTDGVVVAAASKTGYALSAAGVQAIWDALTSALTTVGSIGKLLVDRIDAAISSRGTGTALDAAGVRSAVGLASANLDTQLADLPTAAEIVAAQLTTAITEAYRANGAAPTLAQFMSEVLAHLGESSISGTTKTINKLDHSTAAATFTLDDANTPASITRAT